MRKRVGGGEVREKDGWGGEVRERERGGVER